MLSKTMANFLYSNEFYQLFKDLKDFWRCENEPIKDKFNKRLRLIHKGAKICLSYMYVAIVILVLVSLFSSRSLPVYVYVPKTLGKKFIFALECVILPLITLNVITFDYLIFTFLQLIIMQFQLLNSAISKLNTELGQDQTNFKPQLLKIIKHHIFLLEFARRLKQIMSLPLFLQLFNSIPSLCFEMYLMRTK